MNDSAKLPDRPVEEALREILEPLDRQLARTRSLFPLALVTLVPAFFFAIWLGVPVAGVRAVVMSGGACCALIALHLCWEILASHLALGRFDRRFPPGTPGRSVALRILNEMETPSRAEEKLRTALANASSDRIVRRVRTDNDPLSDHVRIDTPHSPAGQRRPGGYYDYIPLEPRRSEEDRPGDSHLLPPPAPERQ